VVANAGGDDLDQHLAGLRTRDLDLFRSSAACPQPRATAALDFMCPASVLCCWRDGLRQCFAAPVPFLGAEEIASNQIVKEHFGRGTETSAEGQSRARHILVTQLTQTKYLKGVPRPSAAGGGSQERSVAYSSGGGGGGGGEPNLYFGSPS